MAWYHVGGCDCPIGCCDCCDDTAKGKTMTKGKKQQKKKQKSTTISGKDLEIFKMVVSHYMDVSYEGDGDEFDDDMDILMKKLDDRLNND